MNIYRNIPENKLARYEYLLKKINSREDAFFESRRAHRVILEYEFRDYLYKPTILEKLRNYLKSETPKKYQDK